MNHPLKPFFEPMNNFKFNTEFELRASPKVLYPYISTASGLQQWFAEKVTISPAHVFDFLWDRESHPAKMSQQRLNKMVRFDFIGEKKEAAYVEIRLDVSDLTGTTFLRITDVSANHDENDLQEQWEYLTDKLKDIVGG